MSCLFFFAFLSITRQPRTKNFPKQGTSVKLKKRMNILWPAVAKRCVLAHARGVLIALDLSTGAAIAATVLAIAAHGDCSDVDKINYSKTPSKRPLLGRKII